MGGLKMYCIYDRKVELYNPPVYFRTEAEFMRAIVETLNDVNNMYYKYSEDYCAYYVGSFNDFECKFDIAQPILKVVELSSLVNLKSSSSRKVGENEACK